ncbi:MAG: hypothetical protein Q9160_000067 [Pyrenula sp. 1 TL-2023]
MAPVYKIALIQLHCEPLNPSANFQGASQYIRDAASQGATLAVLPEYHLTGWAPDDPSFSVLAKDEVPSYLAKYQALAAELQICIVPGTIVQSSPPSSSDTVDDAEKLLNTSTFISSTGAILGDYTKKNLWHPERPHLSSGIDDPHSVIDTPLGLVGILICWDMAFPEAFRALVRQGTKIVIVPTFWMLTDCSEKGRRRNPRAEALFLESMLTARAFENTCAVVFVNAGGKEEDGCCGLSQVAMPFIGKVPGSFEGSEEGMRVVEIDMEILQEAEENYKVREDLARSDWHYGYEHSSKIRSS